MASQTLSPTELPAAPPPPAPRRRWSGPALAQLGVCAALIALCFRQEPGRLTFDTKLDLTIDPLGFLHRALFLWEPEGAFGGLQNQAYGYLFPIGPFFALGRLLDLPPWVVQRAWMSLLLVVAFLGLVRLAERLGIGSPWSRIVAGLGYALCPRMLTVLGPISAEALPISMLPWVILPLVRGAWEGSPRRAAGLSALAVFCMGAANAALTVTVLVLPALWLLTRPNGPRKWRLTGWWLLGLFLACLWWILPLLLFAEYSPPFIDFVEVAAHTTAPTSLFQVLRGTSDWVAYVVVRDEPWWRGGWTLVSQPGVLTATAVAAGLGMAGLAWKCLPYRRFVAGGLLLGLVLITFGHTGPLTPPWADSARTLLDGPLVPFRNIHKFDAVLRLPLALGLAHLLISVPAMVREVRVRRPVVIVAVLAVLGVATPALAGHVLTDRTFTSIPSWWEETADYLAANSDGERALLVPATGFAQYRWGQLIDEPMQPLAASPWAVRNQIPLGSLGNIRMLDAVEDQLGSGRGSAGLAPYLARSGVKFLVVRNDIDWVRAGAVRPSVVHTALDSSAGLKRVAAFGPQIGGAEPGPGRISDFGVDAAYPAVEIYAVNPPGGSVSQVDAYPVRGSFVVSGGPESVLRMLEAGVLGQRATVLAGERAELPDEMRSAVTDGLRRREIDFGKIRDHASATLTRDDPLRLGRKSPDISPVPGDDHQTIAGYVGATSVRASSAASEADALYFAGPSALPFAAFDGEYDTSWISSATSGPVGQWIEITLARPVQLSSLTVRMMDSRLIGTRVTLLRVKTDTGDVPAAVGPGEGPQTLPAPAGWTSRIRLTVEAVQGDGRGIGLVGIRDLRIPGVKPERTLITPRDAATLPHRRGVEPGAYVFTRAGGGRVACVRTPGPVCSPDLARQDEEGVAVDRTFLAASSSGLRVTGAVRAKGGEPTDALLRASPGLTVTASSRLARDPAVRPETVIDRDTRTGWVADIYDQNPRLFFRWPGERTLDRLRVEAGTALIATRPDRVRLVSPAGVRELALPPGGEVRFRPLTTDRITVEFPEPAPLFSRDSVVGTATPVPVGVAELRFPALDGLVRPVDPARSAGARCGQGPPVTVDGIRFATRVTGTVGDVLAGRPLAMAVCKPDGETPGLTLFTGTHRVRAEDTPAYAVASVSIAPPPAAASARPRETTVLSWGTENRSVRVGPGPQSFLVVHENANAGWTATLDGLRLRPVRVDGWQQAWILPEGEGGKVVLSFEPGRSYRYALIAGVLGVLGMLALILLPRRSGAPPPLAADSTAAVLTVVVLMLFAVALCGPLGLLALLAAAVVRARGWPGWALTVGAFVTATLVVLGWAALTDSQRVADGWLVQSLCLLAIAGIVARLLPEPDRLLLPRDR